MRTGRQTGRQLAGAALTTIVLWIGSVVSPQVAPAATYYVAPTGQEAHPGTQEQPLQTIDQGVRRLQAGDTLYIRGGTYSNQHIGYPSAVRVPSGTSWANPVTIAGYPGEVVTLTGSGYGAVFSTGAPVAYVILDNLVIDGCVYFGADTHHVRLSNSEIKNGGAQLNVVQGGGYYLEILHNRIHSAPGQYYGLYMTGHHNLFDGNEVYNNGGYGFHLFNRQHTDVSDNTVRNNHVHDNGSVGFSSAGMILASGSNNVAYNNIIRGQRGNGYGIQIQYLNGSTPGKNQVYHNTLYGNASAGIVVGADAINTVVTNNLVYGNGSGIVHEGAAGVVVATNLCGQAGPGCTVIGDPQFVNAAQHDFHLQADSPARNAGTTLSVVLLDFDGVARSSDSGYDIGAYEYRSSPLLAPQRLMIGSMQ